MEVMQAREWAVINGTPCPAFESFRVCRHPGADSSRPIYILHGQEIHLTRNLPSFWIRFQSDQISQMVVTNIGETLVGAFAFILKLL